MPTLFPVVVRSYYSHALLSNTVTEVSADDHMMVASISAFFCSLKSCRQFVFIQERYLWLEVLVQPIHCYLFFHQLLLHALMKESKEKVPKVPFVKDDLLLTSFLFPAIDLVLDTVECQAEDYRKDEDHDRGEPVGRTETE